MIIAAILLIDAVPLWKDWLGRIHIGRHSGRENWSRSITETGKKWLNSTPKIKVTDNTRLVIIDILKGNYTKTSIQHWQEASLVLGLAEYLKHHDDQAVKQQLIRFLNKKMDSSGQWIEKPKYIDSAILAYAMMKLDFVHLNHYRKSLDYVWELIKEHIGEDGTVMYRKSMRNYRYVDTVGFICPFLVAYGTRYKKEECIDLAVKQIKQYEKFGLLDQFHIPCHAYQVKNKTPLGLYGWGRGLGWYALGLVDAWDELPQSHQYKSVLEENVKAFVKAVVSLQQPQGCWNWTVTRSEARPDSSTTAALAWFLLNASNISEVSPECLESYRKAVRYLMKVTRRNGAVDFSQGDTKDIGVYSMLFNILPFTQGLCIRMAHMEKM